MRWNGQLHISLRLAELAVLQFGIIGSVLFLVSLYCQYSHWGHGGPRRWFHVTHLIWCMLFMTNAFYGAVDAESYHNSVQNRVIVNLSYAADIMMFTVAALYLSKVSKHIPNLVPSYPTMWWGFFIFNGMWLVWTFTLIALYTACQTEHNSVIPCIQSKGDAQWTVMIRGSVWLVSCCPPERSLAVWSLSCVVTELCCH